MDYESWEKSGQRRVDRHGLVEHFCEHGIGHPNPGSALWIAERLGPSGPLSREEILRNLDSQLVHGCDGCCNDPEFPDYRDSLMRAHAMIREYQEKLREVCSLGVSKENTVN